MKSYEKFTSILIVFIGLLAYLPTVFGDEVICDPPSISTLDPQNLTTLNNFKTHFISCFENKVIAPNFSSQYDGQEATGLKEAENFYLTKTQKENDVDALLWERAPDELNHRSYSSLIRNKQDSPSFQQSAHGRGTLGIFASNSRACAITPKNVNLFLTKNSSIDSAMETISKMQRWPSVINASHAELNVDSNPEDEEKIKSFIKKACENGSVITMAMGNGRDKKVKKIFRDQSLLDCIIPVASANSAKSVSDISTRSPDISVAAISDVYQKSAIPEQPDMFVDPEGYHGNTSGAAPIIGSAMLLAKKINPSLKTKTLKKLLEVTADRISGENYPSTNIGNGIFNGARFIKAVKMFNEKKINESDLSQRNRLLQIIEDSYSQDPISYKDSEDLSNEMRNIGTCEQNKKTFEKLKLTMMVYPNHPNREIFKNILREYYKSLGDLLNNILLDPRNRNNKINISPENFSSLQELNILGMSSKEKIKLIDTVNQLNLNQGQIDLLKRKFKPVFESIDSSKDSKIFIKRAKMTFGEDYTQQFEELRELRESKESSLPAGLEGMTDSAPEKI